MCDRLGLMDYRGAFETTSLLYGGTGVSVAMYKYSRASMPKDCKMSRVQ